MLKASLESLPPSQHSNSCEFPKVFGPAGHENHVSDILECHFDFLRGNPLVGFRQDQASKPMPNLGFRVVDDLALCGESSRTADVTVTLDSETSVGADRMSLFFLRSPMALLNYAFVAVLGVSGVALSTTNAFAGKVPVCVGMGCNDPSDCGSKCFCNNPNDDVGNCYED